MVAALKAAVEAIEEDKFGFKRSEIETHFIHLGAAILDEIPVYIIMTIDRWSSDAFLEYIRK